MQLERRILKLFQAGDLAQAMTHLHELAMVMPSDMEAVISREKQQLALPELLTTEGVELSWEPIDPFVGPSVDMGYVYGLV